MLAGHPKHPNCKVIDPKAPRDYQNHFPAGDKCSRPGCGKLSQEIAARPEGWMPFTPLSSKYKWHAGVCGDKVPPAEQYHLRGGKFYYGGKISATYKQGGVMEATMNIFAHHNGYIEFHVCDVAKCGGEISTKCFKDGHCQQLKRAKNPHCDSGTAKDCAPIDPNYPGRWYMPCTTQPDQTKIETFGDKGQIKYQLPSNLACEHCVLQWFWTGANGCNPPGIKEFFQGPHGPKTWGNCRGQGGAIGGYSRVQKDCGPDRSAEEYLQCADIRIEGGGGRNAPRTTTEAPTVTTTEDSTTRSSRTSATTMEPTTTMERTTRDRSTRASRTTTTTVSVPVTEPTRTPEPRTSPDDGVKNRDGNIPARVGKIKDVVLVADGKVVMSLGDGTVVDISKYSKIAIECVTSQRVSKVEFYVDNRKIWTDFHRPYFMFGNRGRVPNYWKNPPVNKKFTLTTKADGDMDRIDVTFTS